MCGLMRNSFKFIVRHWTYKVILIVLEMWAVSVQRICSNCFYEDHLFERPEKCRYGKTLDNEILWLYCIFHKVLKVKNY